jgi:pimeloyl-ACP methyl ester carboxylesterase
MTAPRITALILIALLVGGLAYLRFAPDGGSVSVPDGAKAGDVVLESCEYATEDGNYPADCGTLVVPENRRQADSRLIALPVTRIHARAADAKEPIFRLQGGPGVTNMKFPMASRFADDRDVVLVGYRGVEGSSVLDCPEVESALKHSTDFLGEKTKDAYADAFRACADRLADDGVDLGGYSLAQRVDDLEAARKALGYDRVDLVSESVGTRTALIYAWRYPQRVHRSVLIAANPPGGFIWDAKTTQEQVQRYSAACAADESCSKRTDDLAGSIERMRSNMPDRWLFLPIKDGNVRLASFFGLMESASAQPLSAPMTLGAWLDAEDGDASGFWFQSLLADMAFPTAFVWGDVAAVARTDAGAAKDYFASGQRSGTAFGDPGTEFTWVGGRLVDAWPAQPDEDAYSRMRTSNVETLVVSGELDFATPPQMATRKLMPYLPNGDQVVLEQFGHSTDFWTQQPEAGTQLITTYLDSGKVDAPAYQPGQVDFTPSMSQGGIAKIVAGSLAGLAALAVLSLLLIALRVRWRGAFGHKASVVLRSVVPIILGLGGWAIGVFVALTTMPGTPLDDELLATVSVGLPVGLGIYLAWVSPGQSKGVGLAAAVGGGLVGAWLGFHATTDLVALLTAIAGAIAGANVTLILLDVHRARTAESRATSTALEHAPPAAAGTS